MEEVILKQQNEMSKKAEDFIKKFDDYFAPVAKYKDEHFVRYQEGEVCLLDASRALEVDKNSLWGYCNRGKLPYHIDWDDGLQTKWVTLRDLFNLAVEKKWI